MPISVEMKVFAAGLGNDITLQKLPSDDIPDWTFINNLQEEVLDLAATVRSDKCGGTTGHQGLIMEAGEFALVPGIVNPPFVREAHPGDVDYLLPTLCTTMQQHTERRLANKHLLHVFEMEQMMDQQLKKHVMSCFHKDIYVGLKQQRIGYTNITTTQIFEYLYAEYGEKTEKLQKKALADLEEEVDIVGPSIILFRLKQEKLLLFLLDTEQAIPIGMYIKTCLRVIERTNYINKAVLEWRRRTQATRTVALF